MENEVKKRAESYQNFNEVYNLEERKLLVSIIEKTIRINERINKPTVVADYYLTKFRDLNFMEFSEGSFPWGVMQIVLLPLEEMPLFVANKHLLIQSVAIWRLKIGK